MIAVENKLYQSAYYLSLFTIGYNLLEGLISTFFGVQDDTLALFGFGADSFIEVASGIGVLLMIRRITASPSSSRTDPEKTALQVTGIGFYILTAVLIGGAVLNVVMGNTPTTTLWGVVVSVVSIAVMFWLTRTKIRIGTELNSAPIIADGRCTQVCLYMSVVLLASSLVYYTTGFAYADVVGALGLAYFAFREGREAMEKAANPDSTCGCDCH